MRILTGLLIIGGLAGATLLARAQGPGGGESTPSKAADVADLVSRMMAFDADKDGKLTKEELTDARLLRLFNRADADKDGTVSKAELTALAEKEHVEGRGGPGGFGGPGGPPGFGPPGGPGGPGGIRPGDILAPMFRQRLELSVEQEKQIDSLQKEVDEKLSKSRDDKQRTELKQMRERGPGRFGPPGGGRRGGPPGGPPPPPGGPGQE
jgi:hypothetical protein